jgi:Raf kinase inhibitor-like YbhB/YbcL family protein
MQLISPVFQDNTAIPTLYTCDGEDINPPLQISGTPSEAITLAFIMKDLDAPSGTFYHWVLFNMDDDIEVIEENSVPGTAIQGKNSSGNLQYVGPCPPAGTHRYLFTVYALDSVLNLDEGAIGKELEEEIEGHIIDSAVLVGLYGK